MTLNQVGDRTLTATYTGAPGFDRSSDTEPHRVDQAPPFNRPPDADYNWHCEGLTCDFVDRSQDPDGQVTGWSWDFGDGTLPVTQQNPTHTFPGPGTYTVTLTAIDNGGASDAASATVEVEAPPQNQPPVADFNWSCNDLECSFQDRSTDNDGSVVSWAWNFGDGGTSGDQNPSHTYASAGPYQVSLTVTDDDGASTTATATVNVTAPPNEAPDADFQVDCEDATCDFEDRSRDDDGSIVSWLWDFGDGTTFSGQTPPPHTYAGEGPFPVTLTVTDDDGASGSRTRDADPDQPDPDDAPTAVIGSISCTGMDCTFTDASTDPQGADTIRQWSWIFGDGENFSGQTPPVHSYAQAGTYTVELTVRDVEGLSSPQPDVGTVTVPAPGSGGEGEGG
jgi:PKD repeat protein